MDKARNFLGIIITGLLLFSSQSQGYTFLVTNSTQLQEALTTAQTNGEDDEIRIIEGTYTASGPFVYGTSSNDNHSVTLSGGWSPYTPGWQDNDPGLTILDGASSNGVLQILADAPGVNITFKVENLTIENGYVGTGKGGGAILADSGTAGQGSINLEIRNCILQNNYTPNNLSGGAIYSNCALEVYDTKFLSNSAYNGGAMFIIYDLDESPSASPVIDNCYFEDNSNYGNQGSTIWTNCAPRINNCTFKGRSNGTSSSGPGSCIWGNNGSHLNIVNSVFSDITIKYWGPAVQVWYSDLDITNCLFANNHAGVGDPYYDSHGAIALLCYDSNTINIANCTFTGNTGSVSYSGAIHNRGATVNLNNCIFWDNGGQTGVYNDYGATTMRYCSYDSGGLGYSIILGGGNINADPIFIGGNVFRLSADSPCIDAGNNDLVPIDVTTDVAGKPRFRDDPYVLDIGSGTAPTVDIGAYEFVQTGRFGYVNGKKNTKLTLKDTVNNDVTFSLSGTGLGTIDPCDPNFELIEIYNFNADAEKAALAITSKSKAGSSAGSIYCYGPMKSITAKNISFTGDMTIGSAWTSKAAVTIVFDEGEGLNIKSEMPIKSIAAMDWWDGSLAAPSVGSITTKSNPALDRWGYLGIDVDVDGVIGSVKVADEIGGTWNCKSVTSITAWDTDDFYLTLSQKYDWQNPKLLALGKMTIKEDFAWSRIMSSGNIGTVTAGAFSNSTCFAAIKPDYLVDLNIDYVLDLPPAEWDTFSDTATIKSIVIKGVKGDSPPYFVNSNIAASNIQSVSLLYPEYANGGTDFGVTAAYIKSIKVKDEWETVTKKYLDEQADLLGEEPPGNLKIRLW